MVWVFFPPLFSPFQSSLQLGTQDLRTQILSRRMTAISNLICLGKISSCLHILLDIWGCWGFFWVKIRLLAKLWLFYNSSGCSSKILYCDYRWFCSRPVILARFLKLSEISRVISSYRVLLFFSSRFMLMSTKVQACVFFKKNRGPFWNKILLLL